MVQLDDTFKQISLMNPYYAEKIKQRGISTVNLRIVENFFIPKNIDLEKITDSIKDCKTIIDIGSGYGLLINSLAKLNPDKDFLGIDTMYCDKEFQLPKSEKNVRFEFNGIEAMTSKRFNKKIEKYDAVICCWMPDQSDWREMLSIIAKKIVILILSKFFASGTLEVYVHGMKSFGFKLKSIWDSNNSLIQIWCRR